MRVEADHAQKLDEATQKLLNKTRGLHRRIGEQLALDADLGLAPEYETGRAGPASLSFRDCWTKLQRSNPELFDFEEP